VVVVDDISKGSLTTEYKYHHGYWDGAEREFRGFGMVEQLDTESFATHLATNPALPVGAAYFSPPVLTKTWFHLGPVEDASGQDWHEVDWSKEWWSGDPPSLGHKAGVDSFLQSISSANYRLTRRDRRDALRALRGSVLRTEMYGLDGGGLQSNPYTVTEIAYEVSEVSNPLAQPELRKIYFPHVVTQRATQWERGEDPLTKFAFSDDYDAFGQPRQQTNVAAPRRSAKRKPLGCFLGTLAGDVINETQLLATHTRTAYAVPDAGLYIYDRVAQVRSFELAGPGMVQESDPGDVKKVLQDQYAAARGARDGFQNALHNWQAGQALPNSINLFSHTIHHYDGNAFVGRAAGAVGPYGALARSEVLVFTDAVLNAGLDAGFSQTRRPAYLGGAAAVPNGAPAGFGSNLGYSLHADEAAGYHAGYYSDTKRAQFDFQDANSTRTRGLLVATKDSLGDVTNPLDHTTQIGYDAYGILPVKVTDAVGVEITADYDYRVMQPSKVVDPNGNVTSIQYSPSGLLQKQWLLSRDGSKGGSQQKPESEFSYDFLRYAVTRNTAQPQPIYMHSRQRERHAIDPLDANPPDTVIESREFSDGFGRTLQKRAQAEDLVFGASGNDVGLPLGFANPALREQGSDLPPAQATTTANSVVVSGWQVYDNKGHVVEKYEPFFSTGWDYLAPLDSQLGALVTMYYDARGVLARTVTPDLSEQRVVFGIPESLDQPDQFEPTPWETYTYDASDLASLAPSISSTTVAANPAHVFTPASELIDGMERTLCAVQRNGPGASDCFITRSSYDIRGNVLAVTDALGRKTFTHTFDLLNRRLRNQNVDAGDRTSVLNAQGNLVERHDSKGSIALHEYDALNRLVNLWAINDGTQNSVTVRERVVYGDGGTRAQLTGDRDSNRALNRLGKAALHYDEAGRVDFRRYDFKGNLVEKARRCVSDQAIASGWVAHWSDPNADVDLDPATSAYQTNARFDAMNRHIEIVFPQEAKLRAGETAPHRAKLTPHYNQAGSLERVELDGVSFISQLAYTAKGQRMMTAYGNGVMTRYAYDPLTFRSARLRSEKFQTPAANQWQGSGEPLQDYVYRYDYSGNVASIDERVRSCGVDNSPDGRDQLVRAFTYDAIYRLITASGRACANRSSNFIDSPNCGFYTTPFAAGATPNQDNAPSLSELCQESYSYDPVGNMLELDYDVTAAAGPQRLWVRRFAMGGVAPDQWQNAANNRLTALQVSGTTASYAFDDNGNLRRQNLDTFHSWDHSDRMTGYRVQAGPAPSLETRYLYDSDGTRVKKWTRKAGGVVESTAYIDGIFEYHAWTESGAPALKENNHLHVVEGQNRTALIRAGDQHSADAGPPIQYHLGDHLGSSSLVVNGAGTWVNREEFFAYGETSLGSFAKKRYRFMGKERDEDSGLSYHGARYYASWLGRWTACDPSGSKDILQLYCFVRCNPLVMIDPSGASAALGSAFLGGIKNRAIATVSSMAQAAVLNAATGGTYGIYMMVSSMTEAYHEGGGGGWGVLNAVNSINPVNTLLTQGTLANEEAGQALYLEKLGDTKGAVAHAEKAGAAFTEYGVGAVELGMTVAGGIKTARKLGVPGTSQTPAVATATSTAQPPAPKTKGQILKAITKKHNDAADKLASELQELGVDAEHSGNKTIKGANGKSIKGTEGTATTRKPDVVAPTDSGAQNTGIEVKTSESPATVQKAADQLANEKSFEGKGFFDDKPWTVGEGTGVVYTPHGILNILKANKSKN